MCLGVPGRVVEAASDRLVDFWGDGKPGSTWRTSRLPGDYILNPCFAIRKIPAGNLETLALYDLRPGVESDMMAADVRGKSPVGPRLVRMPELIRDPASELRCDPGACVAAALEQLCGQIGHTVSVMHVCGSQQSIAAWPARCSPVLNVIMGPGCPSA
jgi:hydrogenase maturation factor